MSQPKTALREVAAYFPAPVLIVPTGAIRPGHWLFRDGVLFVADEDASEARALWPDVPVGEINNTTERVDLHGA